MDQSLLETIISSFCSCEIIVVQMVGTFHFTENDYSSRRINRSVK